MPFASSEAPVASWMFAAMCLLCAGFAFGYDTVLASVIGAVFLVVAVLVGVSAIVEGVRNIRREDSLPPFIKRLRRGRATAR